MFNIMTIVNITHFEFNLNEISDLINLFCSITKSPCSATFVKHLWHILLYCRNILLLLHASNEWANHIYLM